MESTQIHHHTAWNKRKLVGKKAPFKLKEIWATRVRLEMRAASGNSRCSIAASTVSCALVTDLKSSLTTAMI